ncbi:cytochrome c family protein [Pseudoxanthobacter sp.]|uniref:c-type cytochrome n=1 Tax=Pseudoxanthobacter sp. TaxID=1925742 RepID=UPI002FDFA535
MRALFPAPAASRSAAPLLVAALLAAALFAGTARAEDAAPLPAGNAEAGARVFNRCKSCHQIGENAESSIGPELNGVIGRPAGKLPGYSFSEGLAGAGFSWDEAHMAEWLRGARKMIPTTKMITPPLRKDQDIADLMAYLSQFGADGQTRAP